MTLSRDAIVAVDGMQKFLLPACALWASMAMVDAAFDSDINERGNSVATKFIRRS